jgi:hypothetical protein
MFPKRSPECSPQLYRAQADFSAFDLSSDCRIAYVAADKGMCHLADTRTASQICEVALHVKKVVSISSIMQHE